MDTLNNTSKEMKARNASFFFILTYKFLQLEGLTDFCDLQYMLSACTLSTYCSISCQHQLLWISHLHKIKPHCCIQLMQAKSTKLFGPLGCFICPGPRTMIISIFIKLSNCTCEMRNKQAGQNYILFRHLESVITTGDFIDSTRHLLQITIGVINTTIYNNIKNRLDHSMIRQLTN